MRLLDDVEDVSVLDEFTVMLPRERAVLILAECCGIWDEQARADEIVKR